MAAGPDGSGPGAGGGPPPPPARALRSERRLQAMHFDEEEHVTVDSDCNL